MVKSGDNGETKLPTEELILRAAEAVFQEKGLAGARMQEIADRAGINKALLHYYFKSKDKLSEVVISRAMGLLMPRLLTILEADVELFEKIRRVADEYRVFLQEHQFLPLFLLNEANRNPQFFFVAALERERPRLANLGRQLAAEAAQGRIRPTSTAELLMTLLSLLIFPVLGRPLFQAALGVSAADFEAALARHHAAVADFIVRALQV